MKAVQRLWINRLNGLFYLFLGLLAGMSLIHLVVLFSAADTKLSFLTVYAPISKGLNIVFMIFASFAVILGFALSMIYKHKSDEKLRIMDPFRLDFRRHYILSLLISCIIAFSLGLLYILPHFTNKFYYYNPANIADGDVAAAKGLYAAVNVLLMIAWLLASAFNKASINDMDMDPTEEQGVYGELQEGGEDAVATSVGGDD